MWTCRALVPIAVIDDRDMIQLVCISGARVIEREGSSNGSVVIFALGINLDLIFSQGNSCRIRNGVYGAAPFVICMWYGRDLSSVPSKCHWRHRESAVVVGRSVYHRSLVVATVKTNAGVPYPTIIGPKLSRGKQREKTITLRVRRGGKDRYLSTPATPSEHSQASRIPNTP